MKRIFPILVILLCIAMLVLPVTAATGKDGNPAGETGPSVGSTGLPQVTKGITGPAETPTGQIREENRVENQENTPKGNEIQNRTETRLENQTGETSGDLVRNRTEARIGNQTTLPPGQSVSQIRESIRLERQQMNATLQGGTSPGLQRNANQNEVHLAVRTLLAMENITGGIGPQVSAIAREFNNSVQSTWQYEDRIRSRDPISRLLFGGDQTAAGELSGLTVQNENRIRQIEQLMSSADLDPETRALLEEQLRTMEQENTRLGQVSAAEQQDKGIFGWIGK